MAGWLPLLNYSTKYSVSLSTLRRRIKSGSIEFKLDQGKYFILDDIPARAPVIPKNEPSMNQEAPLSASVLNSANKLVEEIKTAYAKVLQEKEEQISRLKEEVVDLRMLVRVLEDTKKENTFQF